MAIRLSFSGSMGLNMSLVLRSLLLSSKIPLSFFELISAGSYAIAGTDNRSGIESIISPGVYAGESFESNPEDVQSGSYSLIGSDVNYKVGSRKSAGSY